MGYPELPPDNSNLDRTGQIGENFNPPTSEDEATVGDSPYSGYEQLTFDGESYTGHTLITENSEAEEESDEDYEDAVTQPSPATISYPADFAEIECGGGNSFPDVVPVDTEIAQEVWNSPADPNRSNAIELDDTRTNQIITLMSGISLPSNCIPEWAQNLSEDKWKEALLEKIRGQGDTSISTSHHPNNTN